MRKELTVRGLIIGIIITLVFTAANVYFGLKAGLTFSTSIPAAVISMAILRGFKDATVQENNIVQTVASAAGTLSSIIFVLPGLIMIGWWTEFPFWISFLICALGGILGVMYSIPLRRALVTSSDLPYPEGVACAEVLKVGSSGDSKHASDIEHGRSGLLAVLWGSIVAAVFAVLIWLRYSFEALLHDDIVPGNSLGFANKEIGQTLGISPRTVKFHVANVLRKFNIKNRRRLQVVQNSQNPNFWLSDCVKTIAKQSSGLK
jgi:putative OPT family oligopeptide transporter